MNALNGKKTYALVILAAISAAAIYAQQVITNGFDLNGLLGFINSEAMVAAFATIRMALSKNAK